MMQFTDTLIESYEKHAYQRESSTTDEFKERERSEFLKLLKTERRKSLLEIGCGPGRDAQFFQSQGFQVLAVDNAPTMVKLTAEKGVAAQVLDCYDLDQIDETFDAVYTLNCLLHIPKKDIGHIFTLIATRLNRNGLMYLGLWGGENFEGILERDPYQPKRFFSFWQPETLLEVLQQSFRLEYYRRLNPREGVTFNSIIARKQQFLGHKMIEIQSHNHASELISLSGAYLELNESENSLPIGLAYRLAKNPRYYGPESPLLLSILEQGRVIGVAIMTPPQRLILSRFEASIEVTMAHLARYLRGIDTPIPGVTGPATEAQAFSEYWTEEMAGISARVVMQLRVFEVRTVADVPLSPGKLRLACMADHPLMTQWIVAFSESIGEPVDVDSAKSNAQQYIEDRQLYIWDDGGPVSIATETRPIRNGTTISTVYTPPEYRSKGYATSCVWSLTKRLLSDRYSFCSLYTDLSNPTSNSIYTKIGYVPLGDALSFDFVPSSG